MKRKSATPRHPLLPAMLVACLAMSLADPAHAAGEVEVSRTEWQTQDAAFSCRLYHDEDSVMDGTLRCFRNTSDDGSPALGEKVFEFREPLGPVSVSPAGGEESSALLSMWASGAYACYIGFGYTKASIRQLFRQCTKGGVEVLTGADDSLLFLVTDYANTSRRGWLPDVTTLYLWKQGALTTAKVPWASRLRKAQKLLNAEAR